ncbi:MAG: type II toxin-antitoxin system death-on-curing family toxin [Gammaproteobacteria bacterium]|nr:type II toxin-antitoxin system death-on-curing family toxin [Gammaproteobacteria bacterium]
MHARLVGEFGGLPGLPRTELLQSSLGRPQQLLADGAPPPSLAQLAAAYGFALARNHCFSDGNKRIALAVIDVFLRINGSGLTATEEDAADTIRRLAAGELAEADLAAWIAANMG